MRDPARIDRIVEKLREYWHQNPDLRICQMLSNLAPSQFHGDIFYVEDEHIEVALDELAAQHHHLGGAV